MWCGGDGPARLVKTINTHGTHRQGLVGKTCRYRTMVLTMTNERASGLPCHGSTRLSRQLSACRAYSGYDSHRSFKGCTVSPESVMGSVVGFTTSFAVIDWRPLTLFNGSMYSQAMVKVCSRYLVTRAVSGGVASLLKRRTAGFSKVPTLHPANM